jgi:hypothetical protein
MRPRTAAAAWVKCGATQHRFLAGPAAIKLIPAEALGYKDSAETAVLKRRFEREAQATAMLTSPDTIHLYDFGGGSLLGLIGQFLGRGTDVNGPVDSTLYHLKRFCYDTSLSANV